MQDEFEMVMRELFAREGRYALEKALRRQPLQFIRLMSEAAGGSGKGHAPVHELTEEEADRKVIGLLRALGEERLNRLLARARQDGE